MHNTFKFFNRGRLEQTLNTRRGFHQRERPAICDLVPQHLPNGISLAGYSGTNFLGQGFTNHFISIQKENIVRFDILQQTCALRGKTLPVIVALNFCTQLLGDFNRSIDAATVHDHNLICELGALNALGNPKRGSIYSLHNALHFHNPHQRPHMRASSLGENRMTRNGKASAVVQISRLRSFCAACKDACLFKNISFDCAW